MKFSEQIVSKIQISGIILAFQKQEFREVKKNNCSENFRIPLKMRDNVSFSDGSCSGSLIYIKLLGTLRATMD